MGMDYVERVKLNQKVCFLQNAEETKYAEFEILEFCKKHGGSLPLNDADMQMLN